jgi:hypothetical protein
LTDPQSLHKYLYTHADPVNGIDPSGLFGLGGMIGSLGAMLGSAKVGVAVVGTLGVVGGITGYFSNSSGAWYEGLIPGWGSGRGLGNAIKNGDLYGAAFNSAFLAVDLLSFGLLSIFSGTGKTAGTTLRASESAISELYKKLVQVVNTSEFQKRALKLGFKENEFPLLLKRLEELLENEGIQIGKFAESFYDGARLVIGESNLERFAPMTHEMTHLFDDVIHNICSLQGIEKWFSTFKIEYRAWYIQSGFGAYRIFPGFIFGLFGGGLTPFANLVGQQAVAFSLRELAYTWLANTGVTPYDQEW